MENFPSLNLTVAVMREFWLFLNNLTSPSLKVYGANVATGAGVVVVAGALAVKAIAWIVGIGDGPHADKTVAATIRMASKAYKYFLDIFYVLSGLELNRK